MARSYELKKRAERQEQTRQRIVAAAVALHSEVGPARTTVSAIAERAGVERHTYYRHFPDERSLLLACSGRFNELNPMPDPASWASVTDAHARLRRGLTELYEYYARNESMLASINRDAAVHALTAEINALRLDRPLAAMRDTLTEVLPGGRQRRRVAAAVDLALAFSTWQGLTKIGGLTTNEATQLMADMISAVFVLSRPGAPA